jgi:hypothetical protein
MATTTINSQQQQQPPNKKSPKAPSTLLEFLQAALFLEDPDLPEDQRIGMVKLTGIVMVIIAYVGLAFSLVLVACIVTPLAPALRSPFAAVLNMLTPPESWFQSAYKVRLARHISSRVASAFGRSSSTVAMAAEIPALQRLATARSSYVMKTL